ncbi:glycosyltransferase family 2 protein [Paenibacillus luteus]|uniref:glycosyltransferase family 2 protein n=1 Tax=Paenibacillus luteus TaxID=2545753 RepID=UPI0011418368|nr:glycosyltransferase [Paenibacillus luteus]
MPKVTVLMPVYNGELFLREAIESILNQNFNDFELVLIDDGSIDQSAAIISSYADPRIRFYSNGSNRGLIFTLNKGLDLAEGEYIARMDCDDFAFPDRLGRQVEFMNQYPEIGLCGTAMKYMHQDVWVKHPTDHDDIKAGLLFYCALNHPTVMMRKSVVKSYALYYDYNSPHTEDYELWSRMAHLTRVTNLPDVLLHYRIHGEQVGAKHGEEQRLVGRKIVYNQLIRMGLLPSDEELNLHMDVCNRRLRATDEFIQSVRGWFDKLRTKNNESKLFTPQGLENVLNAYFAEVSNFYFANRGAIHRTVAPAVVRPRRAKSVRGKSRSSRKSGVNWITKRGRKTAKPLAARNPRNGLARKPLLKAGLRKPAALKKRKY